LTQVNQLVDQSKRLRGPQQRDWLRASRTICAASGTVRPLI
jgi:hypothetical protein